MFATVLAQFPTLAIALLAFNCYFNLILAKCWKISEKIGASLSILVWLRMNKLL